MTPDAVGAEALTHLLVTRHMVDAMPRRFGHLRSVAALRTGVLAQTGVETLELIRGAVSHIRPTVIIAVDALAARSRHRLCATVQLSDAGLTPGSGVGNHRKAVDASTPGRLACRSSPWAFPRSSTARRCAGRRMMRPPACSSRPGISTAGCGSWGGSSAGV